MKTWPKMQFRFYGVSKWTGKLVGDATEIQDVGVWARSRGIDISGLHPIGNRPVPSYVESSYPHEPTYITQEDADTFFS